MCFCGGCVGETKHGGTDCIAGVRERAYVVSSLNPDVKIFNGSSHGIVKVDSVEFPSLSTEEYLLEPDFGGPWMLQHV